MKKIILIAAFLISLVSVNAQTFVMTPSSTTITYGVTGYLYSGAIAQTYNNIAFQAVISKATTYTVNVIAGSAYIQGSNDGTNYKRIGTTGSYTLTLTDQTTNTYIWSLPTNPYKYYRIETVGSGTMVATQTGLFLPRR